MDGTGVATPRSRPPPVVRIVVVSPLDASAAMASASARIASGESESQTRVETLMKFAARE
jgi:hypothetical protein